MILQIIAAVIGTIAFALLFGVPKQYYLHCGIVGGIGWAVYQVLSLTVLTQTEITFFATVAVVVCSRIFAVRRRCPVTVFLISGIFPLVPGAGIYWTSYYIVTSQSAQAQASGYAALRAAVAIVLGIVVILEIPNRVFGIAAKKR